MKLWTYDDQGGVDLYHFVIMAETRDQAIQILKDCRRHMEIDVTEVKEAKKPIVEIYESLWPSA